jgi:UDP-N-acetylglucosamine 2-epimerase (non-hydrolysing)
MHRPSNVDDQATLKTLVELLLELGRQLPLVLPMHPRTKAAIERSGLGERAFGSESLRVVPPLPYRENLCLMASARVVLTDSGGMQEETTILGIPCLTMRENTERPITVELGTSRLVGHDPERIRAAFADVMAGRWPPGREIPLWDGRAAARIADEVERWVAR